MALKGRTTYAKSTFSGVSAHISWTATQDVAQNTSTITARLYITTNNFSGATTSARPYSLTVAGSTTSGSKSVPLNGTNSTLVASKTVTVTHDTSGAKSFSLSAAFGNPGAGNVHVTIPSTTFTLDSIRRKSTFTLEFTGERSIPSTGSTTVPVKLTPADGSYKHLWELTVNGEYIEQWDGRSTAAYNSTSTQNLSLASSYCTKIYRAVPNAKTASATMKLSTYIPDSSASDGLRFIGSSYQTFTVRIPKASTFGTVTVTGKTKALHGTDLNYAVKGYGTITTSAAHNVAEGASLSTLTLTGGGEVIKHTHNTTFTPTDASASAQNFKFEMVDSRGYSTSTSRTCFIADYESISVTLVSLKRQTANRSKIEAYLWYRAQSLKNSGSSTEDNSVQITMTATEVGSGRRTTLYSSDNHAISTSDGRYALIRSTTTIDTQKRYSINITVSDKLSTATIVQDIQSARLPFAEGKDGVGAGGMPVEGTALTVTTPPGGKGIESLGPDHFNGDVFYKGALLENLLGASLPRTELTTNYLATSSPSITISAAAGNVTINFSEIVLRLSIESGNSLTLALATAGFRPPSETIFGVVLADGKTPLSLSILPSGAIIIKNSSGSLIPSNSTFTGSVTYQI